MTQALTDTPKPVADRAVPRLLHLGCGLITPAEWVNVDGSFNAWIAKHPIIKKLGIMLRILPRSINDVPWAENIVIANITKRLPFADNSFDAVFSSHTIEHLRRSEALATLKEAWRVLRPGGRCRTLVPDLRVIIMDYVRESAPGYVDPGQGKPENPDPARRFMDRTGLQSEVVYRPGWLYSIYIHFTAYHEHKWMYDVVALQRLMEEAGFRDCRPMAYLESGIPHLDKVEREDRVNNGAVVEGIKG